jgi:hypothetical protein
MDLDEKDDNADYGWLYDNNSLKHSKMFNGPVSSAFAT